MTAPALFVLGIAATVLGTRRSITGKVTDASGAVLPGVDVTLTSPAVMGARSTVADGEGGYRFGLLPPGVYAVKFALQGFGTVVREGVQISAGFTSTLNVAMNVGSVAETITVVGASPLIDVTNAVVATTFTEELTAVLPTGHDVFSVLAITPGVQVTARMWAAERGFARSSCLRQHSQWNVIEGASWHRCSMKIRTSIRRSRSPRQKVPMRQSRILQQLHRQERRQQNPWACLYDREPLSCKVRTDRRAATTRPHHHQLGGPLSVVPCRRGRPFMRDKLWWFLAYRTLNSDNWTPGYVNTQTGLPSRCTRRSRITRRN